MSYTYTLAKRGSINGDLWETLYNTDIGIDDETDLQAVEKEMTQAAKKHLRKTATAYDKPSIGVLVDIKTRTYTMQIIERRSASFIQLLPPSFTS